MTLETNIKHHLNDQLLLGYAAGILPEAFDLVVATHLSLSDESRARLASFESIGGGLLDEETSAQLQPNALSSALDRISNDSPVTLKSERSDEKNIFPEPLRSYLNCELEDIKWKSLGMGVKQAIIPTSKGASARLLYIPAGAEVPDHGHRGTELTLVLQGAFSDEVSRFARGDIEIANEDLHHTPKAEKGQDCICLSATDAPLRFNAMLPRILQPIFRI